LTARIVSAGITTVTGAPRIRSSRMSAAKASTSSNSSRCPRTTPRRCMALGWPCSSLIRCARQRSSGSSPPIAPRTAASLVIVGVVRTDVAIAALSGTETSYVVSRSRYQAGPYHFGSHITSTNAASSAKNVTAARIWGSGDGRISTAPKAISMMPAAGSSVIGISGSIATFDHARQRPVQHTQLIANRTAPLAIRRALCTVTRG
jgi:hypothetical protein